MNGSLSCLNSFLREYSPNPIFYIQSLQVMVPPMFPAFFWSLPTTEPCCAFRVPGLWTFMSISFGTCFLSYNSSLLPCWLPTFHLLKGLVKLIPSFQKDLEVGDVLLSAPIDPGTHFHYNICLVALHLFICLQHATALRLAFQQKMSFAIFVAPETCISLRMFNVSCFHEWKNEQLLILFTSFSSKQ